MHLYRRFALCSAIMLMPSIGFADDWRIVREAVGRIAPGVPITTIQETPVAGIVEVHAGERVLYVSSDGLHAFDGALIDTKNGRDLTENSRALRRAQALAELPEKAKIRFGTADAAHRVTVFTAIDCGYCRKFHTQIGDYLAEGISVDYVLIPLGGTGSAADQVSRQVYCADDSQTAFTTATNGGTVDAPLSCPSGYSLAVATAAMLGISRTPTIVAPSGEILGGYLTPAQLRERLQR